MTPLGFMTVFMSALVADITWARYVLSTSQYKPVAAAAWAVGIMALGAVSIDAFVVSRWYVIPAALGSGIGTFVTVWHAKRSA